MASNHARIATGTLFLEEDMARADISVDVFARQPTRLPWTLITLRD